MPLPARRFAAASALVAGLLVSLPVQAQTRTQAVADASRMSCAALKSVIKRNGAVTVYSIERDPHINLAERLVNRRSFRDGRSVERYVSHRGFCFFNEVTRFRTVTTQDTERCSVKLCVEKQRNASRR